MVDTELWAKRVADWRSSGETFSQHCKGKEFTPSALRYRAGLLGEAAPPSVTTDKPALPAAPGARGARLQRTRTPEAPAASAPPSRPAKPAVPGFHMVRVQRTHGPAVPSAAAPASDPTLVVELGGARVAVRPGFDRTTLTAVLEILTTRAGGR